MKWGSNWKIFTIISLFLVYSFIFLYYWEVLTSKGFPYPTSSWVIERDELEIALAKASTVKKTVIIAVINGAYVEPHENEYPSMFDLFLEGFWNGEETRPLLRRLLVVSMDRIAHERCEFRQLNCYLLAAEDGEDVGERLYMSEEFIEMMWRRTAFLLDVLRRGYNFIFTDTDVLWLRDPFTRLITTNESLDLQISTDVYSGNPFSMENPFNTGFYFIKSSSKTASFFQKWYDMRNNATGMKEQDVLVRLLRQGVHDKLNLNVRVLDTLYFSGFCNDTRDIRLVATVHANCCQSIKAKVVDLKSVLRDWKTFKDESNGNGIVRNGTNGYRWSNKHVSCRNSWHNKTSSEIYNISINVENVVTLK